MYHINGYVYGNMPELDTNNITGKQRDVSYQRLLDLSGHLKIDKTNTFMTNASSMKIESIA